MSFESYEKVYDGYSTRGTTLRAGGAGMSLALTKKAVAGKKYRLFVVGETALFYQWKDEPDYPAQYRTVTDALDTVHAHEAHYCLNLSSKQPEKYIRRVYKKVLWPPMLSYLGMSPVPDDWCWTKPWPPWPSKPNPARPSSVLRCAMPWKKPTSYP